MPMLFNSVVRSAEIVHLKMNRFLKNSSGHFHGSVLDGLRASEPNSKGLDVAGQTIAARAMIDPSRNPSGLSLHRLSYCIYLQYSGPLGQTVCKIRREIPR